MRTLLMTGLVSLVLMTNAAWAKDKVPPVPRNTPVGVVTLVDAEVMHYHAAKDSKDSFVKVQAVDWPVQEMLNTALKDPLEQKGLIPVSVEPTDALIHARESCFVNAPLATGNLPRTCAPVLQELAGTTGVNYLIIMAPGLSNPAHEGKTRSGAVSESMRGWGFLTRAAAGAKDQPALYNEIELLFVSVNSEGVALRARQWGGVYSLKWLNYTLAADIKQLPAEQLNQLQPHFATLLARQSKDLLDQVAVAP